jgi:membrane associated rhomboid family serine protease
LRFVFILICVSLFGLFPLKGILDWLSGGPVPSAETFFILVFLLILPVCLSVIFILDALRGLPRLTITPQGVSLQSSLGTRWANWDSVESFAIRTVYAGRFGKPNCLASARVVGPNTNKSSRRAKVFSVPDIFQVPIDIILKDINVARSKAVGVIEVPAIEPSAPPVGLADFKLPWLTFALLAVLIGVYVAENVFAITPRIKTDPSIATLFALGALNSKAVLSGGQWYRLFTAPLLHASLAHIAGNGVALLMGGWLLERFVGRLWFFVLFVVGAVGGSLMSLAVVPANLVSVGASGAIMGLFAALCVGSFHLPSGTAARSRMQINSARVLVPSLLPLFSTSSVHIDYGAHFGGAIGGAVITAFLLKFWPKTERIPQLRKVAATASIVGAILFVASACIVVANYPTYRAAAARPLPAIIPRQHSLPSTNPRPQPDSPAQKTRSNIVLDHGPGRVACDLKWNRNSEKSAESYPDFLWACMNK